VANNNTEINADSYESFLNKCAIGIGQMVNNTKTRRRLDEKIRAFTLAYEQWREAALKVQEEALHKPKLNYDHSSECPGENFTDYNSNYFGNKGILIDNFKDLPARFWGRKLPVNPVEFLAPHQWIISTMPGSEFTPERPSNETEHLMMSYFLLAVIYNNQGSGSRFISEDDDLTREAEGYVWALYGPRKLPRSEQQKQNNMKTITESMNAVQADLETQTAPAPEGNSRANRAIPESRSTAVLKVAEIAYGFYELAIERDPRLKNATDQEIYDWLSENLEFDDKQKLPLNFETYVRYLREYRKVNNLQKNKPRYKRPTGRSIQKADEI